MGAPRITIIALVIAALTGCSGGETRDAASDDGGAGPPTSDGVVASVTGQDEPVSTTSVAASIAPVVTAESTNPTEPMTSTTSVTPVTSPTTATPIPSTASTPPAVASTVSPPTAPPPAPVSVPQTGVPGLDSDDEFCAAWSRFGGTWQVLLVGSFFLEDPRRIAEWEVVASPVVLDAYDTLLDNLPSELESERAVVADGYFGVLARRAESAAEALAATGASEAAVDRLGEVWLDALASRDPSTPDLVLIVPDDLTGVVSEAADRLQAARVPIAQDPSMDVSVATPLTDEFIETSCPDRGTLAGGEVDP